MVTHEQARTAMAAPITRGLFDHPGILDAAGGRWLSPARQPWTGPDAAVIWQRGDRQRRSTRPRLAKLAAIWPYDPCAGVVANAMPVGPELREAIERTGYTVIGSVRGYEPYTHVITTGTHDYLVAVVPAVAATGWVSMP